MKGDRIFKILAIMAGFVGVLALSVGKLILAFAGFVVCAGILITRGGGTYNNRNLYNKMVPSEDGTIDGLYEYLKNTNTFLGKCWRGSYKGFSDDCIIFGPDAYKDCIVIAKNDKHKRYELMSVTAISKIERTEENEHRFDIVQNTEGVEVTPKNFSVFAAFTIMGPILLDKLREEIEKYVDGKSVAPDAILSRFSVYHYNSKDDVVKDYEDNELLTCGEVSLEPFEIAIKDMEGNEMASIKGLSDDPKRLDKNGFDIYANGEKYGHIEHIMKGDHDSFVAKTDDGEFKLESFIVTMRARISSNYNVYKDGKYVATIANSTKIVFESIGNCKLCVVMSADDDYLVLYMLMNIFIATLHKFLR